MTQNENLKFYLASHLHSSASLILNTLLDKRSYNGLNSTGLVSNKCRQDLIELSSSALRNEIWALKVFDSNGQLRSGISSGSFMNSVGDYDQCRDSMIPKKERVSLETKFCLIQIDLSSKASELSTLTGQPKNLFAPIGGRPAKIGLCLPKNCTPHDVTSFTDHILSSSFHDDELCVQTIQCDDDNDSLSQESNFKLISSLVILVLLIAATTAATILDLSNITKENSKLNKSGKTKLSRFMNIFSIFRGCKKLMAKRKTLYPRQLDFRIIDGLRVMSMFWIIVVHSYNFGFQWLLFDNLNIVDNVYKGVSIQWVANGTFLVDNFFLISGFLACFKCLSGIGLLKDRKNKSLSADCEREEVSNSSLSSCEELNSDPSRLHNRLVADKWLLIRNLSLSICTRYLRLVPTMMFLILMSVSLLPRLTWAPNWSNATIMFDEWCRFNWYINTLLLQNFINTPNMCFSHSWYLAVDFQLFITINLFVLLVCYCLKTINLAKTISYVKWLLISAIILTQLSIATLIYQYQLPSAPLVPVDSLQSMLSYYGLVYIKPYYWLTSYFIGSLLAICTITFREVTVGNGALKNRNNRSKRVVRVKRIISIMKFITPFVLIALTLSLLPYFRGTYKMIGTLSSLHALFARPLWSLSLAFILFVIILQRKRSKYISRNNIVYKMVHAFLSLKLWLPLSRLTYSAYLFHPLVMATFYGSRKETFKFSHSLILYFCLGNIILTYIGSLFIYLIIELPIQLTIEQMTSLFLIRFRKNKDKLKSRHKSNLSAASTSTQNCSKANFLGLRTLRRPR